MKLIYLLSSLFIGCATAIAQDIPQWSQGNSVSYKGETIQLNSKSFYIDGDLDKKSIGNNPYVFASINDAVMHLTDGTAAEPMTLYIAPNVYWIDNPDDPEVREPKENGSVPYGLEIACNGLKLVGLSDNPQDVVLACNRGQTQGAVGNFTMLRLEGNDFCAENITFGNYCNVDLEYPRNPSLNRKKRMDAIVQAQLALCRGDRYVLQNCRFISRLNLCPFTGGQRTLFQDCYFECTDDALCGTGVYVHCGFTFFSSKPFYATSRTGAIFFDCDFRLLTEGRQYFTKVGSPVTLIDSRFHTDNDSLFIGWTQVPTEEQRNYQYNVSFNGNPYRMHPSADWLTVDLTHKKVSQAYWVSSDKERKYNLYNLLRGDDDWDPMKQKEFVTQAEKQNNRKYTDIPTLLTLSPIKAEIESSVSDTVLTASFTRFGNYPAPLEKITWKISPEQAGLVDLIPSENGTCRVIGTNIEEETRQVVVTAVSESGLEAASVITVRPKMLSAPEFIHQPKLSMLQQGTIQVQYELNLDGRRDESLITWYRCTDTKGSNAVEVSVSRLNKPEYQYHLSAGDIGYYLMASVAPKHLRCQPGPAQTVVTDTPIRKEDVVPSNRLETDFHNFSVATQPRIMPGFWTVDTYKPLDTEEFDWEVVPTRSWFYGKGTNGASTHYGLLQGQKGARLLYTPTCEHSGDMTLTLKVDPAKTAGQGFGSATGQYMDICIKFDTRILTGYALRIIRTVKHDSAVDFMLVRYENGKVTPITDPVSSSCYLSTCTISLAMNGQTLKAHVESNAQQRRPNKAGVMSTVDLEATVDSNSYGGVGIQHTGSTGDSATQLRWLQVEWKNN